MASDVSCARPSFLVVVVNVSLFLHQT
ncbi:BnaC04g26760D [Brassica napus]|uniref:BnaC04g26760D protein n=1 Tax=Brassica napus TaxID=3708 RepID=A0A078FJK4_BRANA|nr:BnaC04g26760D [Brassica napus]